MAHDLGDVLPLGVRITDEDGDLADPSSITLTLTLPSGTSTTLTPAHPSTGIYTYDYLTETPGRYVERWVATGSNAGTWTNTYDVWPADPRILISLEDARAELNFAADNTDDDEEVRAYLRTITEAIEGKVGPVLPTAHTETLTGRSFALNLAHYPVVSITSVVEYPGATTVTAAADPTAAGYRLSADHGVLYRNETPWSDMVTVTYTAGRGTVPAAVIDAAKLCLRHMWGSRQTSVGRSRSDNMAATVAAWRFPNAALEILETARLTQVGGFA